MSPREYWKGDTWLIRDYLAAEEYRRSHENYNAWLSGLYFCQSIASTIGNVFLENGDAPEEYPEAPFPVTEDEAKAYNERQEENEVKAIEAAMMNLVEEGRRIVSSKDREKKG